jgi:hypothetical protein
MLARAALQASVSTVRNNLDAVADQSFVDGIERRAAEVERTAAETSDRVLRTINRRLAVRIVVIGYCSGKASRRFRDRKARYRNYRRKESQQAV